MWPGGQQLAVVRPQKRGGQCGGPALLIVPGPRNVLEAGCCCLLTRPIRAYISPQQKCEEWLGTRRMVELELSLAGND